MKLLILLTTLLCCSTFAFTITNQENEKLYLSIKPNTSLEEITKKTIAPQASTSLQDLPEELDITLFYGILIKATFIYGMTNSPECTIIVKAMDCHFWDFACNETKPQVTLKNCGLPKIE